MCSGACAPWGAEVRWIWLSLILLVGAAGLWAAAQVLRPGHPAQALLRVHLAQPPGTEGIYPRLASTLRSRAWLLSAPGQPDGIAPFTRLSEADFPPERVIHARELRPTLTLIQGRTWDVRLQAWTASDPNLQPVPMARVRAGLDAACPTPVDARLIVDLLLGQPAPGVPDLASRLLGGRLPDRIVIQPFNGLRGQLLRDIGTPPYLELARSYDGCLLRFEGAGWPQEWRVGRLSMVGY